MTRKAIALLIGSSLWLCACSRSPDVVVERRSENDSIYFKKWHYEDGVRKKVEAYNVKNRPHGLSLLYYPDGTLQDSSFLFEGKYHGYRYEFRQDGQLMTIALYNNGDERSRLELSQGGLPAQYKAWNYELGSGFVVQYDSAGIISAEGNAIFACVVEDTIRSSKKASVELWVAIPPGCIASMVTGESGRTMKRLLSKTIITPDSTGTVRYSFKRKRDQEIYRLHILTLQDTVRKKIFQDTLYLHVQKDGATKYSWKW